MARILTPRDMELILADYVREYRHTVEHAHTYRLSYADYGNTHRLMHAYQRALDYLMRYGLDQAREMIHDIAQSDIDYLIVYNTLLRAG